MKPVRRSRPIALYIVWALALIAAVAYQFRATEERFPRWFGSPHAGWPFLAGLDPAAPQLRIGALQANAKAAGLKDFEILTQVNGCPATSLAVFGEAVVGARPGDVLQVQVRSDRRSRSVSIPLGPGWQSHLLAVEFVGAVLVPVCCILLGFWVTAVRPRDALAWLLLAFLLDFTSFFNPFLAFGGRYGETSARSMNTVWIIAGTNSARSKTTLRPTCSIG